MMNETTFSQRLKLLHGICLAETFDDGHQPSTNLDDYQVLDSANYLACFIAFKAIQAAERSPGQEAKDNFDMLSVYHSFALLSYAFLTMPLAQEEIEPDFQTAQIVIAKTLFAGASEAQMVEVIEGGLNKFRLIAEAENEHWSEFRENLDKVVVSFVIAGTDDDSPHDKAEIYPIAGQLLSQLCEAFEAA